MGDEHKDNDLVKFSSDVIGLIDILHHAHIDNAKQQYSAESIGGHRTSIMPLTPFVYEFFIFNSLYQVDWVQSFELGYLAFHPDNYLETKQQNEFMKFIKQKSRQNPQHIHRAFLPLSFLAPVEGAWTKVTPDARITVEQGQSFFKKIRILQDIILETSIPKEMPITKKVYELIKDCSYYIYLVRNNIFHGSKTLGEVYEPNQRRRIEVYDLFLKGITSLFFLSVGKSPVAIDFVQLPIVGQVLASQCAEILDINAVWSAAIKRLMKPEDSRLLFMFTKLFKPIRSEPIDNSALFYPSAGRDLITPILLGLPYCREFYFYESGTRHNKPPNIAYHLKSIQEFRFEKRDWYEGNNEHSIKFKFNGIERNVYWIHQDNKKFLERDVNLAFYFHRGDSWGEGGSGQKWDSDLLSQLIKKIPSGVQCLYLTDGEPGGLSPEIRPKALNIHVPYSDQGMVYYCGSLSQSSKLD